MPAFTQTRVRRYAHTLVQCTEELCAGWQDHQAIDLCAELTKLTMRIAFQVFLSTDLQDEDLDSNAVASAYAEYLADRTTRLIGVPFWLPTSLNQRARTARQAITQVVQRIVDQRIASRAKMDDVLDLALAAEREGVFASRQQVIAEMVNLLTSYLPATASILSTVVDLLSEPGQSTYQRLLQEAAHVLLVQSSPEQDDRQFIRFRAAWQASQLQRPFVPALLRVARGPQTLPGDLRIPSGSFVIIAIHALHHQAEVFPHPDVFCPERFVRTAPAAPPQRGFLAFGAGVHTCLGNHYAELLGTLVLATLCRLVRFEMALT